MKNVIFCFGNALTNEKHSDSFVSSKARAAPLERVTLPWLELLGVLMGATPGNQLISCFKLSAHQLFLWTDSMLILHWTESSSKQCKSFVAN